MKKPINVKRTVICKASVCALACSISFASALAWIKLIQRGKIAAKKAKGQITKPMHCFDIANIVQFTIKAT